MPSSITSTGCCGLSVATGIAWLCSWILASRLGLYPRGALDLCCSTPSSGGWRACAWPADSCCTLSTSRPSSIRPITLRGMRAFHAGVLDGLASPCAQVVVLLLQSILCACPSECVAKASFVGASGLLLLTATATGSARTTTGSGGVALCVVAINCCRVALTFGLRLLSSPTDAPASKTFVSTSTLGPCYMLVLVSGRLLSFSALHCSFWAPGAWGLGHGTLVRYRLIPCNFPL